MLEPVLDVLNSKRIVLASSSPRRNELLSNVGLKFETLPSAYQEPEKPAKDETPGAFVKKIAFNKVQHLLSSISNVPDLVIGADTMVYLNGHYYGKPKTEDEAFKCLKSLSGSTHSVFTGVCLATADRNEVFHVETKVTFGKLSDDVIKGYIATGDPFDKAGSYGIQGKGATLIKEINGDFYNVVGLPLHQLCVTLNKMFSK